MRTIFIWDVHACYDELMELLKKIKYDPKNDNLYLTGDFINKWPKGFEVVDFLVNNPQIKTVIWNNEVNFLRYLEWDTWFTSKWKKTFEYYKEKFEKKHIDYIKNLPVYIETEKWVLLHWWLLPWKKLEEHSLDEITTTRYVDGKYWHEFYDGEKTIIYGHIASDGLRIKEKTKGLDTGCVYWKWLTAYCFENGEIWQVSAKENYEKIIKSSNK